MIGPLSGIRVLAVERALAGPYGSMIMGDMGAEIIKLEPPGGEHIRLQNTPPYHNGEPAFFLAFNRNKKSVVLDLTTSSGLEAFYDLVKVSDVVWDNNRTGVMEKLKADYETIKAINPNIISCSITGYGSTGPYATWPSYDIIAQGMVGLLSQTGYDGGPPIKPAPALADISGAVYGAIGVLAALVKREKTGKGSKVDVNLLDGAMSLLSMHYAIYFLNGIVQRPLGSGHPQSVPFGAYKTRDGWITIGVAWPRIARVLGIEWIIDDPRFAKIEDRLQNREELNALINKALSTHDSETWLNIFHAEDIPAGPVYNLNEAIEDPQIKHNKTVISLDHEKGGKVRLIGSPIKFPEIDQEQYSAPPTLGRHTHQVLSELLHYPEEKIRGLTKEQEDHYEELKKHYMRSL